MDSKDWGLGILQLQFIRKYQITTYSNFNIGDSAFYGCSLREVRLNGIPQYVNSKAFHNCVTMDGILFPTISHHLENIIQTWGELEDKLNEVRGVVQWESDELCLYLVYHITIGTKQKGTLAGLLDWCHTMN